jgi:hypothetical protein
MTDKWLVCGHRLRRLRIVTASALGSSVGLWAPSARADGIDIVWLFTRVGGWKQSPLRATALLGALIVIDYLLNFVVIAIPASRFGVSVRVAAIDMIFFTIIAQVADRVGIVACATVAYCIHFIPGVVMHNIGILMAAILLVNFLTSGALIWFLARYYCAHRWALPKRKSTIIATIASILTNPAWAVGAGFLFPVAGATR